MKNYNKEEIKKLIKEVVNEKNPFEVGDLVKLRPDILNIYHNGPDHNARSFYKRLEQLRDQMGKITGLSMRGLHVTVEYQEPWNDKDEYNREYKGIKHIGVKYTDLVPYAEDPMSEGVGYVSDKDMIKDPKHIKGERWRIKFQSSSDIKKHGNTEKSPVKKKAKETIDPQGIREVIQELLKEIVTEIEIPERNYIIISKNGPVVRYFVDSPSQGEGFIQNARLIATKFKTEEEVRRKIFQLKSKYNYIKNLNYTFISVPSNNQTSKSLHTISAPVKKDGEWIVKWMTNGKRNEDRTYYTDDRDDALNTYVLMTKQAKEENEKQNK